MPSMDDELDDPSRTYGDDLALFVDRHTLVREFLGALHTTPADRQILFFHGVGGAGKSLLLRYLIKRGCKQLPPRVWDEIADQPDEAFRMSFEAADGADVPVAFLDFSSPADKAYGDPRQSFDGILILRRILGGLGFSFPIFDFAVVTYGHRRGYAKDKIVEYLPSRDASLVGDLLKVFVTESRVGSIALTAYDHLVKHVDEDARRWWSKRKVPSEPLEAILRLEADTELVPRLPVLLAEDINNAMQRRLAKNPSAKLCIFFDTHDAFWAEQGFGAPASQFNDRDEWLRRFLRKLELEQIYVVFTGRDRPAWSSAEHAPIPDHFVRTVAVGDLSPEDADVYLQQRGVADPLLRERLVASVEVEGGVHPLSLGLIADVLERSNGKDVQQLFEPGGTDRSFEAVGPKLLSRLFRYLSADEQYAVSALGSCRSFDEELFAILGDTLRFHATHPAFVRLTTLSFMLPLRGHDGPARWKVHTLLRKVLQAQGGAAVTRTHEQLVEHFRGRSVVIGDADHIEQLFHAGRLPDSRSGAVESWLTALEASKGLADVHTVLRLLALEDELVPDQWHERAQVALARSWALHRQGAPVDAARLLTQTAAATPVRVSSSERDTLTHAEVLLQLGWIQRYQTHADGKGAFEQALALVEGGPASYDHMRGRLCFGLSGLSSDEGDHQECASIRLRAVEAYLGALEREESPPMRWVSDSSSGISSLAAALRKLGRLEEALTWARKSVVAAEQALAMQPDDPPGAANLQYAHFVTSQVLMASEGADCLEALHHAEQSLAAARRSDSLLQVARAQIGCAVGDPLALVEEALEQATTAVDLRPKARHGHLSLALAWRVHMELCLDRESWESSRHNSRSSFLAALEIAPGYVPATAMIGELEAAAFTPR